jgi:hypothetical protein
MPPECRQLKSRRQCVAEGHIHGGLEQRPRNGWECPTSRLTHRVFDETCYPPTYSQPLLPRCKGSLEFAFSHAGSGSTRDS